MLLNVAALCSAFWCVLGLWWRWNSSCLWPGF